MLGICIAVMIIGMIVAMSLISVKVRRCPMRMPKIRVPLMVGAFACGGFTAASSIFGFMTSGKNLLTVLTVAFGILTAIVFVAYGLKDVIKIDFKGVYFAVPVIYGILRLINIFMVITSVASMWKNFLWALCECAQILFLLELGKVANNINGDDYKKFLIIAFSTMMVGATFTLPNAFLYLPYRLDNGYSSNTMIAATLYCLGITLFEAAFTFSFFSNKNLKSHSRKKRHQRTSSSANDSTRFYIGDVEYHHQHHHHHHHHTDGQSNGDADVKDGDGAVES